VDDGSRFDNASYDALGKAGISWQTVQEVLRTHPQVRQHIGAVLRVAAPDRNGRWYVVALIEEADDEYLVVSARELGDTEVAALTRMTEGGNQ
jgi:hypothetical protein